VFQAYNLFPHLSVLDNVTLLLDEITSALDPELVGEGWPWCATFATRVWPC
jgi:ABC-type polar amino acid transport system ATPase subunit